MLDRPGQLHLKPKAWTSSSLAVAQVAIWPTLGTHAVRFNVEKAPFNDRRLRLAVAHAIDPSGVVQGLLEGCVIAGKGILPPALRNQSGGR